MSALMVEPAKGHPKTALGRAIRLEGGLFGPDFLEKLEAAALSGQKPAHFGIAGGRSVLDEAAALYRDARQLWQVFRHRLDRLPEDDPATSDTRNVWMIPFLNLLGYDLRYNTRGYRVGEVIYAISHRAGEQEDAPPVHIVGARKELGRIDPAGHPRVSPHTLMQEFLNRSDHLWGIVTNGRILRLLRKSPRLRQQAYVEFDLEAMFEAEGDVYFSDFVLLYRLLHRSRLPRGIADAHRCLLEHYYQEALEQGNRARDRLRDGVEKCLEILGTGFLRANPDLPYRSDPAQALYTDLLRLVYRFLFLLVAEERGLLGGNDLYREHYSIGRLRRLADRREAYTDHEDLWLSLRVLWHLMRDSTPQVHGRPLASLLDLPVLDGGLFEFIKLEELKLTNRDLLEAFYHLSYYYDEEAHTWRRVNYAALDVEELGSVYESLLDNRPVIEQNAGGPVFRFTQGTERKSTGSYYTPPELVQELVRSALEPVLASRLEEARARLSEKASPEERKQALEQAIFSIKVVDPATGSGHFLLAAARRLGKELARIRTGEEEPPPEAQREAVRDVIAHCIYGVDKNPLAVELCKVALWIEGHTPGKPLTFLDHRIKCGDSLVGVLDIRVLEKGIPDGAFQPVSGDERSVAGDFKKANRRERDLPTLGESVLKGLRDFAEELRAFEEIQEQTASEVQAKAELYGELQRKLEPLRALCNLWTSAFFQPYRAENSNRVITTATVRTYWIEPRRVSAQIVGFADALAQKHRFFHWPVEFPEIFVRGGFDVVLGNPPWERIKLQEKEFFSERAPEIARAPNAAARKRLIRQLPEKDPALWEAYQDALHTAESTSRFLRESGFYPLTGRGDINTYSVFAERMGNLLRPGGRAGILVPTGIATDATNKHFFADLVEKGALVSLFDFENRGGLFPHVHRSYKFCLLTLRHPVRARGDTPTHDRAAAPKFAFFCTRVEHLRDPRRVFTLTPEDIARINPNTRTLPVFRTRQDAELTKAIYCRVPVLVNEATGENPWGVRFLRMLDMSNDSHLFRTREQLETAGYRLVGNRFVKVQGNAPGVYLPLYEAKMIWHYDHRFGTYAGVRSRSSTHLPTPTPEQHADPGYLVQPWYWVPAKEVEARLGTWKRGWLLGFRNVARSTDERTAIFSLFPRAGVGNSLPIMLLKAPTSSFYPALFGNLTSFVFDWIARQKLAGVNMNFFYVQQFPVLPPTAYTSADLRFIVPRILELTYTAWDIKPFADDVWRDADETLRAAIRAQWEANAAETGGHTWDLPDWITAYPEIETDPAKGIPFPPFKWDEIRRARLRAELDAYYARLYGLTRKQLRYILDPADLTPRELEDILDPWEEVDDPLDPKGYAARVKASDFPGETFRVLKEKETRKYGEYRTRRLILEAWERLNNNSVQEG